MILSYCPAPWHFLYFLPLPHGHGSFRPTFGSSRRTVLMTSSPPVRSGLRLAGAALNTDGGVAAAAQRDGRGAPRRAPGRRGVLRGDGAQPPEVAHHLLAHPVVHVLEEGVALLLVLDERIALAVAAQPDALLQVVEAVEVVLPLDVHDLQHDVALDAAQQLGRRPAAPCPCSASRRGPTAGRGPRRSACRPRSRQSRSRRHRGRTAGPAPAAAPRGPSPSDRPACCRSVSTVSSSRSSARFITYCRLSSASPSSRITPVEDLPSQRVDALPLLVHDVVVLEQVFADREVLRLHLLLRPLDRARHHLVLDRHALFHPQALHQARDPVRPEDPHQVVFERQVEARRARVALAPGAAAQLVVDAPRLVALGADDVQAARTARPRRARRRSAS